MRAFEVEAVGAASVAALSQFLPTIEEASKVLHVHGTLRNKQIYNLCSGT